MKGLEANSLLVVLPGAFIVLLVVVGIVLKIWCARPHLKNTPKDNLVKTFAREREVMLNALVAKHGLTCELEGYLVTADPKLAKALLLSKVSAVTIGNVHPRRHNGDAAPVRSWFHLCLRTSSFRAVPYSSSLPLVPCFFLPPLRDGRRAEYAWT
jgi:hypothetical protein